MRVADNLVTDQAAQQIVDGHIERLALNVPQGDVDGRHGRGEDTLRREEATAEEDLPDVLNPEGIHADQDIAKILHGADHGQFPTGDACFAYAVDPLIGVHHHKEEIPSATPDGVTLYVCDFHGKPLVWIYD